VASKEAEAAGPSLEGNESLLFSMFGTHWYSKGIYNTWRAGTIYITDRRLIMYRKMPAEVLLEICFEEIKAMALRERDHFTGEKRQEIHILLKDEEIIKLHANDTVQLKNAVEGILRKKELSLEGNPDFSEKREVPGDFLAPGEEVVNSGKMWYQMPFESGGGVRYVWKPGHLYLTDRRLCWWYDFEKRPVFSVSTDDILHVVIQDVQFGSASVWEKALIIMYREEFENKVVCFYDKEKALHEWEKAVREAAPGNAEGKNTDTCPRCGKKAAKAGLLENGCSRCGWVSYRFNGKRSESRRLQ